VSTLHFYDTATDYYELLTLLAVQPLATTTTIVIGIASSRSITCNTKKKLYQWQQQ
jgi:hypothetical protein